MSPSPVAFVVQRYGRDVTGGSEALARAVAERLGALHEVTVFTTCARDYVTWRNELPAGEEDVAGVRVRRFPVEEERDLAAFNAFAEPLYARETTRREELEFLRLQGPVVPSLVEALRAEKDRFAAVVFFTYLYYPTVLGLEAAPERSVLVPTTHDEPPLRFSIYREAFARPRAFAFLTPAERALVEERFGTFGRPAAVAGMGVDVSPPGEVGAFRARHGLERPYALYAGRIDAGKGCAALLAHHESYRRRAARDAADLVLIGRLAMEEPRQQGVRWLGFLSEEEKAAAMAGAVAVVCPSPYESLSIVLLEGLALGTPGLVSAASPVLREHCLRSNAGLFYGDGDEYAEALDLLVREGALRAALGANGRRYVDEEYRWSVVLERWAGLLAAVAREGP
ncbi:MAG TPA: glycosyltransferase family 4 protein [Vicinamibacteria bacterium]